MSAAKFSFNNFATKLFLYPVAFLASILIARFLGPEEKGIFAYIILLTSFFIPIFSLGIGSGLRYYVSNKEFKIEEIGFTTLVLAIGIGCLNGVLLFVLWHFGFLGKTGESLSFHQISLIGLTMLFNSVFFFFARIAAGDWQFNLLNGFEILKGMMNPILMILLVYFLVLRIDGVVYAILGLNAIMSIGLVGFLSRRKRMNIKFEGEFVRKSFIYGLQGWIGDMAVRANVRLDQIILGGLVSAKSLGLYSVGVTLAEMIWIIPDSIGPVLFNKIAAEESLEARVIITERIHRLLFYFSVILAIGWFMVCNYIVVPYGYGTEYLPSIAPMMVLIPGSVLYISAKVTTKLLSGSGRIIDTTKATALGSGVSILLYVILIPLYGIMGAAIASVIGYVAVSFFCFWFTLKNFDTKLSSYFIPRMEDFYWLIAQIKALRGR